MHDLLHSLTGTSKSLPEHFAKGSGASDPEAETDFRSFLSETAIAAISVPKASSDSHGDAMLAIDDLVSALTEHPIAPDDQSDDGRHGNVLTGMWPENASGPAATEMRQGAAFSAATDKLGAQPERDMSLKGTQDQNPSGEQEAAVEQLFTQTPLPPETVETVNATADEGAFSDRNFRRHADIQGQTKDVTKHGTAPQNSTVGMAISDSVVGIANSETPEGDEGENVLANNSAKNLVAGDKGIAEVPKAQLLVPAVRQALSDLGKEASISAESGGPQEDLLVESLQGITSSTGNLTAETARAAIAPTGAAQNAVQQLTFAIQNLKDGSIELQLNPEELGRVKLSLDSSEGQMKISIIAERAETADLLRRNQDQLSSELMTAGLEGVVISFGESTADSGEQQQQMDSHSEQNPEQPVQSTFIHGPIAISEGVDLRI